jgi:hypothetical protein
MTVAAWLVRWRAERLFLAADGDAAYPLAMEPSWYIPWSVSARSSCPPHLAWLALAACSLLPGGGGPGPSGGTDQAGQPFELAGVCPNPIVIQTDWNPESEYGATYNLVGAGYRVDKQRQAVRGPLVVEGRATGIDVEVRAGGPIIDFQTIKTFFDDRSITLSFMTTDEAARNYAAMPTISVVAPTEINPQILMWTPRSHPEWTTVVDIGQTNTPVLASADNAVPEIMIGSGILRRQQVNPKHLDPTTAAGDDGSAGDRPGATPLRAAPGLTRGRVVWLNQTQRATGAATRPVTPRSSGAPGSALVGHGLGEHHHDDRADVAPIQPAG